MWFPAPWGRWVGRGSLGHALGLPHPLGCEEKLESCDDMALMWAGFYGFPDTYLTEADKEMLEVSPFIQ